MGDLWNNTGNYAYGDPVVPYAYSPPDAAANVASRVRMSIMQGRYQRQANAAGQAQAEQAAAAQTQTPQA